MCYMTLNLWTLTQKMAQVTTHGVSSGSLPRAAVAQGGPPVLQSTSIGTEISQHSGSVTSQSTGLSHISPFSAPAAQLDSRESLDGLKPNQAASVAPNSIPAGGGLPLQSHPLTFSHAEQDPNIRVSAAPAEQQARLSGNPFAGPGSDQSDSAMPGTPAAHGTPLAQNMSHSTNPAGAGTPPLAGAAPVLIKQALAAPSSSAQNLNGSLSHGDQARAGQQGLLGNPGQAGKVGSPTVDDVLSGRSAATDRAALQELLEIKAPVAVS